MAALAFVIISTYYKLGFKLLLQIGAFLLYILPVARVVYCFANGEPIVNRRIPKIEDILLHAALVVQIA